MLLLAQQSLGWQKKYRGMVRKIISLIFLFFLFFVYLHQRINIYVEAYKLNDAKNTLNKLVDKRDSLLYNFSQRVSLAKINEWVEANGFKFVKEDKILALNINNQKTQINKSKENVLASSFKRLFRLAGTSKALAQQQH